ncbi:MAG: enolase C-terminal domain-like protein [Oscillospiraceae bacterium]
MQGTAIKRVFARQIMGRRYPAISATVVTENGASASANCSAGISVGTHEVVFAYDGGERWHGLGVMNAVDQVNNVIAPALIGLDCADQFLIDQTMLSIGGDDAAKKMGGNALAAVSAAALKAGAKALGIPLYRHMGGAGAVVLPIAAYGVLGGSNRYNTEHESGGKPTYSFYAHDFESFSEASYALWAACNCWYTLMQDKYGLKPIRVSENSTSTGFVYVPPGIVENEPQIWQMMNECIARAGYEGRIGLQVDLAADCFYNKEKQVYEDLFGPGALDRDGVIDMVQQMAAKYNFVSVEDPLHEDDFEGHARITEAVDIQIVGDDLFTTDVVRVAQGVKQGACNCVLLKVNQIGTITQALEMIQLAYENGYSVMPCSSRGEGVDIVDYSVAINAGSIRESGLGPGGNRFLEIERELGARAVFAGTAGLKGRRFQRVASGEVAK